MSDTKHICTQQVAENALPDEAAQMAKAVEICSQEATRLKSAYAKLQERLACVNEELALKIEQLSRISYFMNNLLQKLGEAILFVDLNGTIVVANESAHKMLQRKDLPFKKYWDQFTDEEFGFSMREALRYGISHQLIYKTFDAIGKELEITTSFLCEGPKNQHGIIVVLRDITERQKMQRIAARADRMKELGEMAATVAHEIRNPLGGIRGFATLLYRDLEGQKNLQEMASHVIDGTKALESLVSNVLLYSRPVRVSPHTSDLSQFLRALAKFFKSDPAFPPKVKIALNIPNDPVLIPFDSEALKAAMLNLLFNAIQAMSEGGVLSLSLLKGDCHCQISVADTGIGMDEGQLRSIFSPLFTTKSKGNGLGLVETQKIVQAHGGSIDVRSMPNLGTTFTLTLPLNR